jgi:hypothetical protein
MSDRIREILGWYGSENPGVLTSGSRRPLRERCLRHEPSRRGVDDWLAQGAERRRRRLPREEGVRGVQQSAQEPDAAIRRSLFEITGFDEGTAAAARAFAEMTGHGALGALDLK